MDVVYARKPLSRACGAHTLRGDSRRMAPSTPSTQLENTWSRTYPGRPLPGTPQPYGGWMALDHSYRPTAVLTDVKPAPPRPPRLAAMMASAGDVGLYDSDLYRRRELRHFSTWRLRWCAFCMLIATAMQASSIGGHIQLMLGGHEQAAGEKATLISASIMLALLLIALWSLLSQLLLWSDAAVLKLRARQAEGQAPG